MDLNYLYHRQQVSRFMADNAANEEVRRVHLALAEAYGGRIQAARIPSLPAGAA